MRFTRARRGTRRGTGAFVVLCGLAACAPAPLAPNTWKSVSAMPLSPFEIREECVRLAQDDRLDYAFDATEPVAFEIHYRDGRAVIAPIVRDASVGDAGVFAPIAARTYCLAWEAGPAGALVDYRLRVRPPGR